MAAIAETLQINDQFSATFNHFDELGQRIAATLERMDNRLEEYGKAQEEAAQKTKTHDDAAKKADASIDKLAGTVQRVVAALAGFTAARSFINLADDLSLMTTRLGNVNDGLQTTGELYDMIYQASQRARGNFQDMARTVSSLKAQTGDTFSSVAETVRFTELLNKQFKIAGTDATGIASTMYNLTQALSTGTLKGQDLNTVFANAPQIVKRIADYMDVDIGKIKDLASEGKISADTVKNAILGSAKDINAQFEQMPLTFGDAVQKIKNAGIVAIQPMAEMFSSAIASPQFDAAVQVITDGLFRLAEIGEMAFTALGDAINWGIENMDFLSQIVGFAVGAFLLFQAVSVGSALASAAAWVVANWPILLLAALAGAAVVAIMNAGVSIVQVGQVVGQVFGFIYALGYNTFANLWNVIASFAEFFANVWNDPLAATIQLFTGVFDAILGMVEAVANAIDALLNSNLSGAVSGFRSKLSGWVDANYGDKAVEIKRMANIDTATAMGDFGDLGADLAGKLDGLGSKVGGLGDAIGDLGSFGDMEIPDYSGSGAGGGGKKANVGTVDKVKDVKLSDEDLKIYRDLAEQRYMANIELQTLAPNISVSIPESAAKNLTSQDVADKLKTILIEQAAAHTAVAHAH